MKLKVPYFCWRDGRPRWEPGPGVRALGFRGQDLRGADGAWLAEGPAIARARALNGNVEAVRRRGAEAPPAPETKNIRALIAHYQGSSGWKRLAPRTQQGYAQHLRIIEARFGLRLAGAVVRDEMDTFFGELQAARGLATANAVLRTFKLLLYYARDGLEWIDRNRLTKFHMDRPEGRLVLWTPDEIGCFVRAADEMDHHAQADAAILALFTGQRRGDLLRLPPLLLAHDVYRIVTAKTGVTAYVPSTVPLAERLVVMRARRAHRWPNVVFQHEVISSRTGRAYDPEGSLFGDEFRAVRAAAATAIPAIAQKRFADLRDTAITWLFDAGCDEPKIATITGHSLATIRTVLDKHYYVRHAGQAKAAGALLDAFLTRAGITL